MPRFEQVESLFQLGKAYRRRAIHDQFGGNWQSGISYSAKYPYIFIFSGSTGHQHGYRDQWENEDVFSYTGEGQIGDMEFVRGNLELKDHKQRGKRVFLFTEVSKGFVKYEGELELVELDYFNTPDKQGAIRTAIKFFLKKVGKRLEYEFHNEISLTSDAILDYSFNIPNETERKGLVTSRVGQGAYRRSIIHRWRCRCAVTNYTKSEILIASHIVAWKDSTPIERLDVNNGILLSPTYDALFDRQLISFENSGKIILSNQLATTDYYKIGITGKEQIRDLSSENIRFLERHREKMVITSD